MTYPYGIFDWEELSPKINIDNAFSAQIPNIAEMLDSAYQPRISQLAESVIQAESERSLKLHEYIADIPAMINTRSHIDWAALTVNHFSPINDAAKALRDIAGPITGISHVASKDLPGLLGMGDLAGQVASYINHPDLFAEIHGIATDLAFPTSVTENLAKKLGVFKVSSWETAANIAATMSEVREIAQDVVESHPEVADEMATKVTGKERVTTGELSNDQRLTMFKEALNMLGQSAITSFSSGNAVVIGAQVTLSIVVFILAIAQIESAVRASREEEIETGKGDA